MKLRRYLAAVALPWLLATASCCAQGQGSSATGLEAKRFLEGSVGVVSIGMTTSHLEQYLKRPLELQFAGDGRAGVSFEESADLGRFGVSTLFGANVKGIDILFKKRGSDLLVDFISLGVPCAKVSQLKARLSTLRRQRQTEEAIRASGVPAYKNRYVGGAEERPSCRVWLREA